jgi:hypothetical protein
MIVLLLSIGLGDKKTQNCSLIKNLNQQENQGLGDWVDAQHPLPA